MNFIFLIFFAEKLKNFNKLFSYNFYFFLWIYYIFNFIEKYRFSIDVNKLGVHMLLKFEITSFSSFFLKNPWFTNIHIKFFPIAFSLIELPRLMSLRHQINHKLFFFFYFVFNFIYLFF